jgi:DNA-binding NarL/FixJ family response regulator
VTPPPARILLADADAPTRMGLRLALVNERFEVVGEVDSLADAVAASRERQPDLAIVASDLPGGGLDAVRSIAEARPRMRILVMSRRPQDDEMLAAILAGAVGYLGKDVDPARVPMIIDGVLAGEVALPRQLSRRLIDEVRGRNSRRTRLSERATAPLSAREWEVLHLLAAELGTGEIARRLGISDVTVRRHVSSLVGKLGVPDRRTAVALLRSPR